MSNGRVLEIDDLPDGGAVRVEGDRVEILDADGDVERTIDLREKGLPELKSRKTWVFDDDDEDIVIRRKSRPAPKAESARRKSTVYAPFPRPSRV